MALQRVKIGQKEVLAELVESTQSQENWNEYLMDDGTVLKVKFVLKKAFRVANRYDPQGNPIYLVESQNVLSTNAPDHLKRKA